MCGPAGGPTGGRYRANRLPCLFIEQTCDVVKGSGAVFDRKRSPVGVECGDEPRYSAAYAFLRGIYPVHMQDCAAMRAGCDWAVVGWQRLEIPDTSTNDSIMVCRQLVLRAGVASAWHCQSDEVPVTQ